MFNKNTLRVLLYDVLPTAAENGVMTKGVVSGGRVDLPLSSAYNVEPVTNTSSSSCANNGRRTPHFLPTPPAFDAPVRGGSRRNIAIPFGMEKLEWLGYPMVKKKLKIRLFVLTEFTNVTDGRIHRHRMTT